MAIIAGFGEKYLSNKCENDTKSFFLIVAAGIWSRLSAVNLEHFKATETASH